MKYKLPVHKLCLSGWGGVGSIALFMKEKRHGGT